MGWDVLGCLGFLRELRRDDARLSSTLCGVQGALSGLAKAVTPAVLLAGCPKTEKADRLYPACLPSHAGLALKPIQKTSAPNKEDDLLWC